MGVWGHKDGQNKERRNLMGNESGRNIEESAGKQVKEVRACHKNG